MSRESEIILRAAAEFKNEELSTNEIVADSRHQIAARGVRSKYHVVKGITHFGAYRDGLQEATTLESAWFDEHFKGRSTDCRVEGGTWSNFHSDFKVRRLGARKFSCPKFSYLSSEMGVKLVGADTLVCSIWLYHAIAKRLWPNSPVTARLRQPLEHPVKVRFKQPVLHRLLRVHLVAHRDDRSQAVVLGGIGFAIDGSYSKISNN
jgi:hypothetical protein